MIRRAWRAVERTVWRSKVDPRATLFRCLMKGSNDVSRDEKERVVGREMNGFGS